MFINKNALKIINKINFKWEIVIINQLRNNKNIYY